MFSTDLEMILRAREIAPRSCLGLRRVVSSLSTFLHASNNDYRLIIVKNCCADLDVEGQGYLIERFSRAWATVTTRDQLINALGPASVFFID